MDENYRGKRDYFGGVPGLPDKRSSLEKSGDDFFQRMHADSISNYANNGELGFSPWQLMKQGAAEVYDKFSMDGDYRVGEKRDAWYEEQKADALKQYAKKMRMGGG